MRIKYKSNLCSGVLGCLLGAILLVLIPQQIGEDPASAAAQGIDSRTVPYAMAALILVCSIFLIVQSLVLKKDTTKELVLGKEVLALVYVLCLVLYAFLFKISYILAVGVLGMATLGLLKCKKIHYYIIEAVIIGVLFAVFKFFLGVRLPTIFF